MNPRRVFILGCHRSGTTLVRLILNSHPDIHCFDEWKSYDSILKDEYPNEKNAVLIGLKAPNWTEWLIESEHYRQYYRQDPILFMMRDVRDVITSMLKLKTGQGPFLNNALEAVEIKWPNDPHRKFKMLHWEEYTRICQQDHPNLRKAALFWRYKTSRYLEMVKMGYPVLPVFYEKLVNHPKECLNLVTQFLEIPWHDSLLQHHQKIHDEVFKGLAVGNTKVDRKIDTTSVKKWQFTAEEEKAILEVASPWHEYISALENT